jgi:ketosteroid isomerase-like protein
MKKMIRFYICAFLVSLFFFISCNNAKPLQQETKLISVDSLNSLWNTAWNKHDSTGIVNLLAKDALLISRRTQINGVDSIGSKFVHHYVGTLNDLQTKTLTSKVWTEGCYLSGTYVFQAMQSGKLIGKEEGVFTFIWEKQADTTFKLKVLHMEDYK